MKRDFRFSKYQGCGNDFIIGDELSGPVTSDAVRSRLAKELCDRHFKVGADGVIFVEKAGGVDGSMRLFEPAGNEADMCGNGIRCVASFLMQKLGKESVDILTRDGIKHIVRMGDQFRVDMGIVRTDRASLGQYVSDPGAPSDSMLAFSVRAGRRTLKGAIVNSGEPHIVIKTKDVAGEDIRTLGESVNSDKTRFPTGVNLNMVQVVGPHSIKIRTYERGVYDETLACGTGATAGAAVSVLLGWVEPGKVEVEARGGRMSIELTDDGRAFMTGPATMEFEGIVRVEL